MAQMDSRIILGGNTFDAMGQFARGQAARQQSADNAQTNAFRAMLQEQGPGIMAGQPNALAAMSRFDPQGALDVQQTRQQMRVTEAALRQTYTAAQDRARQIAAQASEADRAELKRLAEVGANMIAAAQTPEQLSQVLAMPNVSQALEAIVGPGMARPENRELIVAGILGAKDGLAALGGGQEGFRRATAEEAAQYGAAAGQFGPDGRFYAINPPSSTSMEMGPDGVMRVTQGPGAGSKPFTEGQSKDVVYATRARGALEAFEPVADAMASRTDRVLDYIPLGIGREMQSSDFQTAQNAGNEFLQAILRKDTGAAITRDEQILYGETFLPQPGDSPQVLDFKRAARQRALAAIEAGMGPAQILAQERALQGGQAPARPMSPQASGEGSQPPAGSQVDDLTDDDLLRMYGVQ